MSEERNMKAHSEQWLKKHGGLWRLEERDRYELRDYRTRKVLSRHPNPSGCKLSALFHVKKGQTVWWPEDGPIQGMQGTVNGKPRFYIEPIEHPTSTPQPTDPTPRIVAEPQP